MPRVAATEHPQWCAGGHHCTAGMPSGEHASLPEVWETPHGRVIATRHRRRDGGDFVEIRTVMRLDERDAIAERQARHLLGVTAVVVTRVFG